MARNGDNSRTIASGVAISVNVVAAAFAHTSESGSIPAENEFQLDFLTARGRSGGTPYEHPDLHVTLQPLRFMEYSLENVQQTALLSGDSATIVNVPHPTRYALHKLIIAGERQGAFQSKSNKDLMQAGLLLAALKEIRPWEVEEALKDLVSRGKGWSSRAQRGLAALGRQFPDESFDEWLKIEAKNSSSSIGT